MNEKVRKSFGHQDLITDPLHSPELLSIAYKEADIMDDAATRMNLYDAAVGTLTSKGKCDAGHARLIATVEGAAVFLLLTAFKANSKGDRVNSDVIYRTIAFYRHFRYFTAQGIINEQLLTGSKLDLGCGSLVPDGFPLSVELTLTDAKKMMQIMKNIKREDQDIMMQNIIQASEAFIVQHPRPGVITAVENDAEIFDKGAVLARTLGINFRQYKIGAKKFLEQNRDSFDFIEIIRLDPYMVGLKTEDQKKFMLTLLERINRGGQIMITIGKGNSSIEYRSRQEAIRYLGKVAAKAGKKVYRHENSKDGNCKQWDRGNYMDLETLVVTA